MHNDGHCGWYDPATPWRVLVYYNNTSNPMERDGFELGNRADAKRLAIMLSERPDVERVTFDNKSYIGGKEWTATSITPSLGEEMYLRQLLQDYPDGNHSIALLRKLNNR